jgi:hypothetical protein
MQENLINDKNKKKSNLIQDEDESCSELVSLPKKEEMVSKKKEEEAPKKEEMVAKKKEEEAKNKKTYSLWDFAKFTFPFLWKGGFMIRVQLMFSFILMFLAKGLNVTHPIILKYAIENIQECLDNVSCPN